MKNIILVLVIILFSSCKNNEKEYLTVIKQNNEFFNDQVETYKVKLEYKKADMPHHYDSIYCKAFLKIVDGIYNLKNYENYQDIYGDINQIAKNKKLNIKFHSIKSKNLEILKNNLFINITKVCNIYEFNNHVLSTHCLLSDRFRIRKSIKNDSIQLNIEAGNSYNIVIDSIIDREKNNYSFKSNKTNSIWSVKYKSVSNKSKLFGKVYFSNEFDDNPILLQKINVEIIK